MKNKKATAGTVAIKNQQQPKYSTKNLFGLTRNQWSDILDNLECTLILGGFALLTFISLMMAWFGRCL